MQWRVIQRIFGIFLMLFSTSMLPPVGVSFWYGDGEYPLFLLSFSVILLLGLILWWPARHQRGDLRNRDGFIIVAMFWTVLGMLSGLPFMFGPHLSFTDSVFEAVSGFTTTGATVITGLDHLPRSVLYFRQQLQWLGGMGMVVLAVAILPMLGVGGMQLYRAETPGPIKDDKLTPRITHTARALWFIYLGLTVACAVAFWAAGMSPFDAIGHSFSTLSTGGFSTHDASLGYFHSTTIDTIAIVFMMLGGMNFAVHFVAWRGRSLLSYWRDPEVRAFMLIVLLFGILYALVLRYTDHYDSLATSIHYAFFELISIITTTGFGVADFSHWPLFLPLLLMVISFIGGCAGSTAGGMKVIRVSLLFRQGLREIRRLIHPRAVIPVKFGGRPMSDQVIESVWGFFSLYMLSTVVLTMGVMATGLDAVSAFSAVATCLNDTGPGLGQVAANFTAVSTVGKWLLLFAMLLGRLEIFTLFVLLNPAFWRR